jgi:ABC-type glycerol-3-phosphate transport system substrate-binding protein
MKRALIVALTLVAVACSDKAPTPLTSVTFLHYFTGSLSGGIDELAETFNEANPEFSLVPTPLDHEVFKTTIRMQLDGPNPPDLFSYWAGARTRYLQERGVIDPIDSLLGDQIPLDAFPESVLEACSYDGALYMLPLTRHYVGFFFNTGIFEDLGIAEPETWEELRSAAAAIKSAGYTPFALGALNRWPAQFWFDYLVLRSYGNDLRESLTRGDLGYDSEEVLGVFDEWSSLIEEGFFNGDAADIDWDEAALRVVSGDAAMTLMGTWVLPLSSDFGFFPFPVIDPRIPAAALGPIDGVLLSSGSRNQATALEVVLRLASPEPQASFNAGSGAIAAHSGVPDEVYNPIQLRIKDIIAGSSAWAFNYDLAVPPLEAEAGLDMLVAFLRAPQTYPALLAELQRQRIQMWEDSDD